MLAAGVQPVRWRLRGSPVRRSSPSAHSLLLAVRSAKNLIRDEEQSAWDVDKYSRL
jgi:hypothetical protein